MPARRAAMPLYPTEAQIAAELGVTLPHWQATAKVLERQGLPAPDPQFDNKRYWPAVRAYLDRRAGLGNDGEKAEKGEEHFNAA